MLGGFVNYLRGNARLLQICSGTGLKFINDAPDITAAVFSLSWSSTVSVNSTWNVSMQQDNNKRASRFKALATIKPSVALVVAGTLIAGTATAQEDEIATDRPDFVESSSVVGRGVFQVETSFIREDDKQSGLKTRTNATPTLMRVGISERVELRLETDGFMHQTTSGLGMRYKQNAFADASFGMKWSISEGGQSSDLPALAMLAHVDAGTGSSSVRAAALAPSLRFVAEWELPGDASFGFMPGLAYQKDPVEGRYWSGILAATYSRPVRGSLRGFLEVAGRELRSKRYGDNQVTFDTGLSYPIDRDTQIDAAVVIGLNRHTPDHSLTIGFSKRFR